MNITAARAHGMEDGGAAAGAAVVQSSRTLSVSQSRAGIFDRNGAPLVNQTAEWKALVFPEEADLSVLKEYVEDVSTSAVQIMTVHKSKGLEFPVVFLCDTAHSFNRMDSRDTVLVHPQLGLGPKVTDLDRHVEYPSLARNAIRLRLERVLS